MEGDKDKALTRSCLGRENALTVRPAKAVRRNGMLSMLPPFRVFILRTALTSFDVTGVARVPLVLQCLLMIPILLSR